MSGCDLATHLSRAGNYVSGPRIRGRHDRLFFEECAIVLHFYIRMTVLFEEDEKEVGLQLFYKPAKFMKHIHPERQREEELLRLRERQECEYIENTQLKKGLIEKFGVVIESSYSYFFNFHSNLSDEKKTFLETAKGGIVWHCFIISILYHVSEECSRRLYYMYTKYYKIHRSCSNHIYLKFLDLLNYDLSHDLYCPILCESPQYEIYKDDQLRTNLQKKMLEEFKNEVFFCFKNKDDFDVLGYDRLHVFFQDVCTISRLPPLVLKIVSLIIHTETYLRRTQHGHLLSYEQKKANSKKIGVIQNKLIWRYLKNASLPT